MGQIESPEPRPRIQVSAVVTLVISMAAAGAAAGFAFDSTRGYLDPEVKSGFPTEEQTRQGIEQRQVVARKGSALGGACAGATMIGVFGLVVGAISRSASRVGIGLVAGVLLGVAFGGIAGYLTQELSDYSISHSMASMTTYFLISLAYWLCLGVAAALTAVVAGSRINPAGSRMLGPFFGSAMAAILTPILATVVFPVDFKGRIPPQETAECYFVGAVGAAFLAIGASIGFKKTDHF